MTTTDQNAATTQDEDSFDLPVFPLNLVLFPGGLLPLKIFEQRYQEMTKTCLRDDRPFGVCRIRSGQEVGTPAQHEPVGCSARITDWDMPHPGLYHLQCSGDSVFRVIETSVENNGLIRARVQPLSDTVVNIEPQDAELCRNALEQFIERVGERYQTGPHAFEDPSWVSYRLAEILPVSPRIKQGLLEQRDCAARVSAIAKLLRSN